MAPGISYDDSGSLASYFGVTCLALILIPATWITLRPDRKDPLKSVCDCAECRAADKRKRALRSAVRRRKFMKRIIPLLALWALFAYLVHGLLNAAPVPGQTVYNPFEILGISSGSTEKQIKKHYRKLSLQYHPDKLKLGENETMEEAESKFIEFTKAYKALTDDTIRENLEKYGNPDGPQQREDKIAIPKWVVEGKSSAWVLLAYGTVLGLGIPFIVGRWWFRQRRLTRDGILNGTAELFFHQLREDTDFISLITILASALEFQAVLGRKQKGSKKQRKERQARIEELETELDKKRAELCVDESPTMRAESRASVTTAVARRVRALLWAHLLRFELEPELQQEQLEVLRTVPPLLNGLTNIALAHNWLRVSLLCFNLQPRLVQAVPSTHLALGQLPNISLDEAQELEITKNAGGRRWIEKFIKADVEGKDEAKKVAKIWPRLEVVSAEFKVTDEKVITPLSIVSLTCKCRYVYPNTAVENGRADSVEAVETAVDEKKKSSSRSALPKPDEKKTPVKRVGYAHAPHWPANRSPGFSLLLGDSKLDKVIVQPTRLMDIPMPNPDGSPAEPREFTLQFQAPPQANLYSFVAYFQSDTLVGGDISRPIMLKVEPPPNEDDSDDDISEPEEDSLAGQMALMRGEKVKPSGVHGDDESEYETDTSSEEDEPKGRAGRAINEDTDSDSD